MSEMGDEFIEKGSNVEGNIYVAPPDEGTTLHIKKFRVGSGNIIGKGVLQDFFSCAGALPTMGGSILHRTTSLVDAMSVLIIEIER